MFVMNLKDRPVVVDKPGAPMRRVLDRPVNEGHQWMMEGYATNGTPIRLKAGRTWRLLLDIALAGGTKVTLVGPG